MSAAVESPKDAARRLMRKLLREGDALILHEYQAADGTPLYWRIRLKRPADGDKWIRPMHANGAGFKIGEPPAPKAGKPLYRLPELLAADPAASVFIVEGESCTDALAGLGIITTTSGSASSADAADWTPLQGRHCVLWPDADKSGARYIEVVAGHLHALGCRVERVDIAGLNLPEGGDVVDWLAQHPNASADDVSSIPRITHTKSDGDAGDAGDTLQHKGLSRPHDVPDTGDAGDSEPEGVEIIGKRKTPDGTPLPYFAFVLRKSGKYPGPGVYYIGQAIEGKEKAVVGHLAPQWVCSPLRVAAKTRDGSQSEWGRLLEFMDSDGHLHRWAMPCELLAGNGEELRRALLREGVTITTNRSIRPQLEIYLQTAKASTHARCVARTGWHGDVFVLPRETFGDTAAEPVLFQAASLDSVALSTSGDLAHWRANVAAPCAGNSRLALALSMAFAGPCLGLLHAEGGGVHLRGSSSAGKSTALHVAASVYGLPEKYGKTWRATDNGLEGTAALHSDLLLILDEMGQLEPRHAGQVAYLLANGQGKARSHRDGSPRAVSTWRVLFLSAGEVGLDALVKEGGGRVQAGQHVRVVDVPADAGAGLGLFDTMPEGMTPGAYADGLKAAAAQYHGTALPAFLKARHPCPHLRLAAYPRPRPCAPGHRPDATAVELNYRYRFADGERDIRQRIELEWAPCRFGGLRAWFRCPRCQRRCMTLYAHGWPTCRTCARLAYPSTRCDAIDRSWRRTRAIEQRMGWQQDHYGHGPKPKGMHATTFARLRAAWWREVELRDDLICAFMARMEVRFPGVLR